jgi:hypothetical protein
VREPEGAVLQGEYEVAEEVPRPAKAAGVGEYDPEDVAAWCLRQRWFTTGPWDTDFQNRVFHPQLLALYEKDRARELERERREAKQREDSDRRAEESRLAAQKAYEHKKLMRDMREWGRENGFFVGTRGRIPQKVMDAYKEAKGL